MIVKRIYFPGNIYSQNKSGFEKILSKHGLLWTKSAFQTHISKNRKKLMSRIYNTSDNVHKILCIYEGNDKPATFFYKTTGSGGNFLIDLISFCIGLGCVIDTKNEEYLNNIILRLYTYGDINIPEDKEAKKEKGQDSTKLNDFKLRAFDINLRRSVRRQLMRYIIANGGSLRRRGISIKIASSFKKKDICSNVRWALENKFL